DSSSAVCLKWVLQRSINCRAYESENPPGYRLFWLRDINVRHCGINCTAKSRWEAKNRKGNPYVVAPAATLRTFANPLQLSNLNKGIKHGIGKFGFSFLSCHKL